MSKILKFYYLVESMIVFGNEKEISFLRILLIIEKNAWERKLSAAKIRDETFPIH